VTSDTAAATIQSLAGHQGPTYSSSAGLLSCAETLKVSKTVLVAPFLSTNDHYYQDRLGTSIGKTQKQVPFV
jgi:hypothetical protein